LWILITNKSIPSTQHTSYWTFSSLFTFFFELPVLLAFAVRWTGRTVEIGLKSSGFLIVRLKF
jgi:hypothetical protein